MESELETVKTDYMALTSEHKSVFSCSEGGDLLSLLCTECCRKYTTVWWQREIASQPPSPASEARPPPGLSGLGVRDMWRTGHK